MKSDARKVEKEIVWRSLTEYIIACGGSASMLDGWRIKSEKSSASSTPVRSYTAVNGQVYHSRADVARHFGLPPVSFSIAQQISRRVKIEVEAAASKEALATHDPSASEVKRASAESAPSRATPSSSNTSPRPIEAFGRHGAPLLLSAPPEADSAAAFTPNARHAEACGNGCGNCSGNGCGGSRCSGGGGDFRGHTSQMSGAIATAVNGGGYGHVRGDVEHRALVERLKEHCTQHGVAHGKVMTLCGITSNGYWSFWLHGKPLPHDKLLLYDQKVRHYLGEAPPPPEPPKPVQKKGGGAGATVSYPPANVKRSPQADLQPSGQDGCLGGASAASCRPSTAPPLTACNRFIMERRLEIRSEQPRLTSQQNYDLALREWKSDELPPRLMEMKQRFRVEQEQAREEWRRRQQPSKNGTVSAAGAGRIATVEPSRPPPTAKLPKPEFLQPKSVSSRGRVAHVPFRYAAHAVPGGGFETSHLYQRDEPCRVVKLDGDDTNEVEEVDESDENEDEMEREDEASAGAVDDEGSSEGDSEEEEEFVTSVQSSLCVCPQKPATRDHPGGQEGASRIQAYVSLRLWPFGYESLVMLTRQYIMTLGITQARLASTLRISSGGQISNWLNYNTTQSSASRDSISRAVYSWLSQQASAAERVKVAMRVVSSSDDGAATPTVKLQVWFRPPTLSEVQRSVRRVMADASSDSTSSGTAKASLARPSAKAMGTSGDGSAEQRINWASNLGTTHPSHASVANLGRSSFSPSTEAEHAMLVTRLRQHCQRRGLSLSRIKDALSITSAGYWSAWLQSKPIPEHVRSQFDSRIANYLSKAGEPNVRLSVLARLGMTRAMSIDDNSGTDDDGTGEGLRVILQLEPVSYGSTALNSAYHQEGQRRQVYSPVDGSSMGGSDERGHRPKRPRDPLYQLSSKLDGPANVAAPGAKRMASQVKRRYQGSSTELRVEALLAERLHPSGARQLLVRWADRGAEADSWEFESDVTDASAIRAFDAQNVPQSSHQVHGKDGDDESDEDEQGEESTASRGSMAASLLGSSGSIMIGPRHQVTDLPEDDEGFPKLSRLATVASSIFGPPSPYSAPIPSGGPRRQAATMHGLDSTARDAASAPICRCALPAAWRHARWWCATRIVDEARGCGFEMAPPPTVRTPLCDCGKPAAWVARANGFWCEQGRCAFALQQERAHVEPTLVSCAEIEQGTSGSLASSTAALLTACAYGPLNGFAFVAPSGTGLGCFARVRLQAGSTIGEIVGPRLPLRLFSPGKEAAAHACGLQQSHIALSGMNFFVDPAGLHSPFKVQVGSPCAFVRRTSEVLSNARLEVWPVLRPSALEVRQHLMLVATELIEAGAEIRIAQDPLLALQAAVFAPLTSGEEDSIIGTSSGATRADMAMLKTDAEPPCSADDAICDAWRHARVPPPPAASCLGADEPSAFVLSELRAAAGRGEHTHLPVLQALAQRGSPIPWEGPNGGDVRLRALMTLLPQADWPLISTHLPGRSGRECRDRWLVLWRPGSALDC